jgi:zinc protease
MHASTFKLPNGLTVVLQENHASRVVAFQSWVNVGSADEPPELAGIAHVFEHMLFKGTARRGVGQIAQDIESAGGEINAWTSFDQTVYHLVLASRFFDTGLDILSDALFSSSFDPVELERELKVVLEEVKQGEDNPSRVATQALFATAFTRHPYRRPVIGYTRTVKAFTRERLLDFFQRHYVANNITLVVVGDFEAEAARKKIARAFERAPTRPLPPAPERVEPQQRASRSVVTLSDVRETHLAIAWHVPGIRHEDTGALDVAAIIVGQGDSSRLMLDVKRKRQVVSDVYAYSYTPRDPGLLVAGATMPPAQLEAAQEAILAQMFRLRVEDVTDEELRKAKAIVESDAIYQKETVQGQARKLGFFETVAGGIDYETEYNRQVQAVTPAQIREVVSRYLTVENATVAVLAPQSQKIDAKKLEARLREQLQAAFDKSTVKPSVRAPATPAKRDEGDGQILRVKLPSGARLLVQRDTTVSLVAMRAVWMGGLRYEDGKTNGVNNLLASLITRGTRKQSGDELAHEVEAMAGSIGGFSGRNSFGIRAELLARHWERGLEIIAECVLTPAFTDDELEKERKHVLEEIRTQEDNVSAEAFRLFSQTLYKKHPYRLDVQGTAASVAGLSRRRMVDYYKKHVTPRDMTLAIVGDVDPRAVVKKARALFGPVKHAPSRPPESALDAPPSEPLEVYRFQNKQQAHLIYGFPGTTLASKDRFALEVLSTILSGQGGRLFVELRDKKGLAYRVSAFSVEGVDPGYFAVYIACSPENLTVALDGIKAELDKIVSQPVPQAELDRAKRYLVGAHEISLQRRAALASTLAFHECYGMGWDEYRRYAPGVLAVTAADVQRVARKYLDPQRSIVATVKPEEAAPAESRARKPASERAARAPSTRGARSRRGR